MSQRRRVSTRGTAGSPAATGKKRGRAAARVAALVIRVVTYRRASRDRSGTESSLTTQAAEIARVLQREGWERVADYGDNDVSGSDTEALRREFERMLRDIEKDAIECDLIVAWDISRLFRNRRDKARLETLMDDKKVHIYDVRHKIDTRTKIGRMMFALMAEWAIDRAEELAEYQRAAAYRRQAEGRPSATSDGYGFRREYVTDLDGVRRLVFRVVPEEARVICWVRDRFLGRKGPRQSWSAITRMLNDSTHPWHAKPRRASY